MKTIQKQRGQASHETHADGELRDSHRKKVRRDPTFTAGSRISICEEAGAELFDAWPARFLGGDLVQAQVVMLGRGARRLAFNSQTGY